jgi:hypothetical protein
MSNFNGRSLKKTCSTEQIISKLREAEVPISQEQAAPEI